MSLIRISAENKMKEKYKNRRETKDLLCIGIDLDNTITASLESLAFFILLTETLKRKARIYILTDREETDESLQKTSEELEQLGIYYDVLCITNDKKSAILEYEISIFFEDTDEYFLNLPRKVVVFKIREEGNFDFKKYKWIVSDNTAVNIDKNNNLKNGKDS